MYGSLNNKNHLIVYGILGGGYEWRKLVAQKMLFAYQELKDGRIKGRIIRSKEM
jgi:hypothetical protein